MVLRQTERGILFKSRPLFVCVFQLQRDIFSFQNISLIGWEILIKFVSVYYWNMIKMLSDLDDLVLAFKVNAELKLTNWSKKCIRGYIFHKLLLA